MQLSQKFSRGTTIDGNLAQKSIALLYLELLLLLCYVCTLFTVKIKNLPHQTHCEITN